MIPKLLFDRLITPMKANEFFNFETQGSQYSKMEKADILEMTVAHLKSTCGSSARPRSADSTVDAQVSAVNVSTSSSPAAVQRYVSGYTECAMEVANYLSTTVTVDPSSVSRPLGDAVRRSLLEHLDSCLHRQTNRLASNLVTRVGSPSMPINRDDRLAAGTDTTWTRHADAAEDNGTGIKTRTMSTEDDCSTSSSIGFERLSCNVDNFSVAFGAKLPLPRSRCDSGICSGASSPTGDAVNGIVNDDSSVMPATASCYTGCNDWRTSPSHLASSPLVTSCVERTYRQHLPAEFSGEVRTHNWQPQQQVLNLTVRGTPAEAGVWRPW
jgi:Hairy Orange